jgi:hypothetical protein
MRRQWAKLPLVLGLVFAFVFAFHDVRAASHPCGAAVANSESAVSLGAGSSSACERAAAGWVAAGNFAAWFAFVGYVLVRSTPKQRRWWHPLRLLLMLGVGIVGAAAGQVLAYALGADLHSPWPGFAALTGFAAGLPVPVLLARRRAPEPASTPEELPGSTPV